MSEPSHGLKPDNWPLWQDCNNIDSWQDLARFAALPVLSDHAGIKAAHDSLSRLLDQITGRREQRTDTTTASTAALLTLDDHVWEHALQCFEMGVLVGWALTRTWRETPEHLSAWLARAIAYGELDEYGKCPWKDDDA